VKRELIPQRYIELMSVVDRAQLGVKNKEEMARAWIAKSERDLQRQLVQYLRLRGIEVLVHRTDKKTGATVGWPDLTFSVMSNGFCAPCGWEVKFGSGTLSPEQNDMLARLQARPNCWRIRVIRTFSEAVDELRELGV
jgi:hypothetical protein